MKIVIHQARIIDPFHQVDEITDLAIEDGFLKEIGPLSKHFKPELSIDGQGKWLIPGLVDLCFRSHTFSNEFNSLNHELRAALKRGITTVCMPPDCYPIIDTPAQASFVKQQIDLPRVYPMGALTLSLAGEIMADYSALTQSGCIAMSQAEHNSLQSKTLMQCYHYAATFNIPVVIWPQETSFNEGVAHAGIVSTRLGLAGIPPEVETLCIAQHLLLIEKTGVKAHFTCLSSAEAVNQIAAAKARGLNISADTAMHSLVLTENDLMDFNPNYHVIPPLRNESDRKALLKGIINGTIDSICSDHRPLRALAKLAPFSETLPGMSTVDTFLSLGIQLVQQDQLPIQILIAALTQKPANLFNMSTGSLKPGNLANICVINPEQYWTVENNTIYSQGKNSPFLGWELPGVVTHTFLNGKLLHG